MISFDIETKPLSEDELRNIMPPFDPDSVAVGNLKDAAKIMAKIEEKRASHESEFFEKAALHAHTATILVIGYHNPDTKTTVIQEADEEKLIVDFWSQCSKMKSASRSMVGVNIHGFDLPFIRRRSWMLGIDVPSWVREPGSRYWHKTFIDLCEEYGCGQRDWQLPSVSFDSLASYFGSGSKPDNCQGKIFYQVWDENRDAAIEYLKNDVEQPAKWARRMGIVK